MRIALIVPRIDRLGPILVIQTLVNSIRDFENLEMKLYYFDKQVDPDIKFNIPIERLDILKFNPKDFDIVHTNGIRPDLFAFINRRKIKFHISTIHNFVFEDLNYTYNKLISIIFGHFWLILWKRADKLICISEIMKTYYSKWYPLEKLEVIHNGIEEYNYSIEPDSDIILAINTLHSEGLKVLGCTGVLTRRKGIDQLLYLLAMNKEFALVIIGDGKDHSFLVSLAEKLQIGSRCLFCGFRRKAVNYFRYFDFFIIPSRSEGFSLALIEAIQQKIPVICSDIDVFKELLSTDEVTFFKLEDINSLMESLKVSAESGYKKAVLAYNRYLNNYTDRLMAKLYYVLYMSA